MQQKSKFRGRRAFTLVCPSWFLALGIEVWSELSIKPLDYWINVSNGAHCQQWFELQTKFKECTKLELNVHYNPRDLEIGFHDEVEGLFFSIANAIEKDSEIKLALSQNRLKLSFWHELCH